MKRILLVVAFVVSTISMKASVADLFVIDDAAVSVEMADLENLESFVEMNQGVTLADVQTMNSKLTLNILSIEDSPFSQSSVLRRRGGDAPLGIPSFVWGFCLGLPGLAVVYFVADDSDETKKALWGCVANTAVGVVFYFVWAALFITAASSAASTI